MSKRGRGKKVYEIKWKHEGQEFIVPVRLYTIHDYKTGMDKRAFCAEFEAAHIDLTDTDSDKLDKAVIEKLKDYAQIAWTLHLVVEISGGNVNIQGGANFEVSVQYDYWVVGVHSSTGKEVILHVPEQDKLYDNGKWEGRRYGGFTPQAIPERWGRATKERSRYLYNSRDPETKTLILATPANKASLDNFMQAMQRLLNKMHEHFQPETIERTLQVLDVLGLPAPPPEKKRAKKKAKKGRLHASR